MATQTVTGHKCFEDSHKVHTNSVEREREREKERKEEREREREKIAQLARHK